MMTVAQALSAIISRFGIEIFNFPDQVQSMVMDYAGSGRRDTRLFCVVCCKGMLSLAQEMYASNDTNQAVVLAERAKAMLMRDYFLAEENAVLCVNMLLEGVGNEARLVFNYAGEEYAATNIDLSNRSSTISLNKGELHTSRYFKQGINADTFQQLKRAGDEGDLCALIQLGDCYHCGNIVKANWRMAEFYYKKAIKLGEKRDDFESVLLVKEAKYNLYLLYNEHQK